MLIARSDCLCEFICFIISSGQVYSNRAACYTKLAALPEGLKDANKCIELDPAFAKGYSRKGTIQFFMKEYDKALETYQVSPLSLSGVLRVADCMYCGVSCNRYGMTQVCVVV